ncbi:MAG: tRNA (5-methylaminomethyl-2-thiouridine)(34)-methyltransferase MnmD, partial [Burkholderiales bacterium]|nr:tRNA (5-methylaminomethyl-2-thiouridine)(34)-methyltransferase MnmD [Burkholderiales bacterium]
MNQAPGSSAAALAPARHRPIGGLGVAALAIAALVLAPVGAVVANVFLPSETTWSHLAQTVLPGYVLNTLILLAGVAFGVVTMGVTTAWLVTTCRFPGSRALEWALILPLAMPAYVMAYAYTDWLQFAGPVQTTLRELTGWKAREYWFPDVRSLPGAIAMLSFALYPYVYLLARTAFLEQSSRAIEAGRLAGYSAWGSFFRVALPLARPGIAAGSTLALMEALADFGTVSYFGVQTFTTGVYRAWLSLGDAVAAGQLATTMLAFVAVLIAVERWSRGRARFAVPGHGSRARPRELAGWRAWLATAASFAPLFFGFLLPAAVLGWMVLREEELVVGSRFAGLVTNSFILAALTAALAAALALWPELAAHAAALQGQWSELVPGWHRFRFAQGRVNLTLAVADARDALAEMDVPADAWFLDGFAPAKNPQMWTTALLDEVGRLARPGTTFATYTAASEVRRGLEAAGFATQRVPGFGRKREMLRGEMRSVCLLYTS